MLSHSAAAAAAKLLQSSPTLCNPVDGSLPASPVPGILRQEHWSGLPFPAPMRESEVAQSCPTLSDPMDCSPLGSSVHGFPRQELLEWVTMPSSRGSSQPRIVPRSPAKNLCFSLQSFFFFFGNILHCQKNVMSITVSRSRLVGQVNQLANTFLEMHAVLDELLISSVNSLRVIGCFIF